MLEGHNGELKGEAIGKFNEGCLKRLWALVPPFHPSWGMWVANVLGLYTSEKSVLGGSIDANSIETILDRARKQPSADTSIQELERLLVECEVQFKQVYNEMVSPRRKPPSTDWSR